MLFLYNNIYVYILINRIEVKYRIKKKEMKMMKILNFKDYCLKSVDNLIYSNRDRDSTISII